jgi:transposase-like protein
MDINLTDPMFHDEAVATAHMESDRWPDDVNCPFCGSLNVHKMGGKTQAGMFLCNDCRDKFTVRTGTIFERSHIPLHKWLLATHIMAASKKSVSALQLQRMLGLGSYRTAWFMCHRIREAMKGDGRDPLGGKGKTVEADETFIGGKETNKHVSKRKKGMMGGKGKQAVFALVERDGQSHSFHVANVSSDQLRSVLVTYVSRKSSLMTDDAGQYRFVGQEFDRHETVNHSAEEYVRATLTPTRLKLVSAS